MKSLILAMSLVSTVFAVEHDLRFQSRNASNIFQNADVPLPFTGGLHLMSINPVTNKPFLYTPSAEFTHDNTAKTFSLSPAFWATINDGFDDLETELRGDMATQAAMTSAIADLEAADIVWVTSLQGEVDALEGALSDIAFSGAWADLSGIPSTFAPSPHSHAQSDITGLVTDLAGKEVAGAAATAQAYAIQRVNHTGTQSVSTITGLATVATSGAYSDLSGRPTIPTNTNQLTNGAGFITTEVDGSTTNEIELPTQTGQSGKILSTNGSSPNWVVVATGTVTSVGVTSSNLTVTGSPVTSSGNIAVSLPSVGTAGTYNGSVTTDAQGRVTTGTNIEITSPTRSIVSSTSSTGFQIDANRPVLVSYDIDLSTTTTIGGPASATVFLETANTNSTTPGDWITIGKVSNGQAAALAVALSLQQITTQPLTKTIPAGKWVRLRQAFVGTAAATLATIQEIKF